MVSLCGRWEMGMGTDEEVWSGLVFHVADYWKE